MNIIDSAKSLLGGNFIDPNIKVYFELEGQEYDVDQFKIGFSQQQDHKGEPQHETKGGQLMITLTQTLPESFYSWIIENNKFKDACVLFKSESSGTVLRIEVSQARCVNLSRKITIGKGVQSILILSPETVKVNGIEHDNFWVK